MPNNHNLISYCSKQHVGCRNDVSQVLTGFTVYVYSRLDFRRLPGPVFDPPRRETAGRVTR